MVHLHFVVSVREIIVVARLVTSVTKQIAIVHVFYTTHANVNEILLKIITRKTTNEAQVVKLKGVFHFLF